jgi:hypothetical protein
MIIELRKWQRVRKALVTVRKHPYKVYLVFAIPVLLEKLILVSRTKGEL